jgi:excisionase family DNA binding protein
VPNVKQVASLLGVSERHVYRMADGGLMPRPLMLGNVNRWLKAVIEDWLAAGAIP